MSYSLILKASLALALACAPAWSQSVCHPYEWQAMATGSAPDVAIADMNGDGRPDLVTCDGLGVVRVEIADSNGHFKELAAYTVNARALSVGDIDGDGDVDLVVLQPGPPHLATMRNDGTGVLQPPVTIFSNVAGTTRPFVLLDLDNDGDLDIVCSANNGMRILRNNGSGTFITLVPPGNAGPVLNYLCAGDFDGDGDLDVAGVSYDNVYSYSVFVFQNLGAGTISLFSSFPTASAITLAMADLDGDGRAEYLYTTATSVNVQYSGGPLYTVAAACCPTAAPTIGDIDGDGDLDAVSGTASGYVVLRNPGNGHMTVEPGPLMKSTSACVLGDIDGDGDLDLALGLNYIRGHVTVLHNEQHAFVLPPGNETIGTNRLGGMGDVDGDGDLDLISMTPNGQVKPLLNSGAGSFTAGQVIVTVSAENVLEVADLDGDGRADVLAAQPAALEVYHSTGGGAFALMQSVPVAGGLGAPVVGDIDGDGDEDIIVASNPLTVLRNNAGAFATSSSIPIGSGSTVRMRLVDLDGDLDLDLVALVNSTGYVYRNDGTGSFTQIGVISFQPVTEEFELGDFDHDGDPDLVAVQPTSSATGSLWTNDGSGHFTFATNLPLPPSEALAIADVDGDGNLDILTLGRDSGLLQVLRNRGDGTFELPAYSDMFAAHTTDSLEVGDFDGDGRVDAVATIDLGVRFLRNTGACAVGTSFCAGDGSGTLCPCANSVAPGVQAGCRTSFSIGGQLRGSGNASIAADTLVLEALDLPPNASVLFFQGTTRVNAGNGATFGDGLRCAGGTVRRLGVEHASSGVALHPPASGPSISQAGATTIGTYDYQAWFRDPAMFCTSATYNLTNGLEILWH